MVGTLGTCIVEAGKGNGVSVLVRDRREKASMWMELWVVQGRCNCKGLYGQSRIGFWPEHKLLIETNN